MHHSIYIIREFNEVSSLKVIEELADAFLDSDIEMSLVFNRQTKELLLDAPESMTGVPEIDWDDDEAVEFLVKVPQITTAEAYDLRVSFAKKQDAELAVQLMDVLNGRKPFRFFKDKLWELNIDRQWYDFENDYAKNRMTAWLEIQI
jgi:hypothetical protein